FVHTMDKGIELPSKVADSSSRIVGIRLAEQVGNPFPHHRLAQIGHFIEADTREPLGKSERFLFPELAASDQPQAHAGFPCAVEDMDETVSRVADLSPSNHLPFCTLSSYQKFCPIVPGS